MPCHAMPCHAMPCHAMPCHAMPCHAMPCHAMPCHAMPCHANQGSPQIRSRLVAMETPYRSSIDPNDWNVRSAETPPLEASRLQMSLAMSGPQLEREDDELVCECHDISRAHCHAPVERLIFVSNDGVVHKPWRTMYGMQGPGAAFDRMCGKRCKEAGCKHGTFTHCVLTRGKPRGTALRR